MVCGVRYFIFEGFQEEGVHLRGGYRYPVYKNRVACGAGVSEAFRCGKGRIRLGGLAKCRYRRYGRIVCDKRRTRVVRSLVRTLRNDMRGTGISILGLRRATSFLHIDGRAMCGVVHSNHVGTRGIKER